MRKGLVIIAALAISAPAAAQETAPPPLQTFRVTAQTPSCASDPTAVVVCGRSQQKYRIDPNVLAVERAAEAPPPKPSLDASQQTACVGPNCGGGTIPLVGMALTALKAAELAAAGDDWRDAFRTHPDQYRVYEEEKARQAKRPHVGIGVTAVNK